MFDDILKLAGIGFGGIFVALIKWLLSRGEKETDAFELAEHNTRVESVLVDRVDALKIKLGDCEGERDALRRKLHS